MTKGITAVVALTMLILIAIVLAGSVYVFFSRMMGSTTETVGGQVGQTTSNIATKFKIDNIYQNKVYLKNIGTVDLVNPAFYINNVPISAEGPSTLGPSEVGEFILDSNNLPKGESLYLMVTAGIRKDYAVMKLDSDLLIMFVSPTPENGETISRNWAEVNVSLSSPYNISSFIDWNRSLVGYWSFDSYSTTHVFDSSTYGNNGSFNGGLSTSNITTGKYGKGMVFYNKAYYVNCGYEASLNITGELTIEAWTKPAASTDAGIATKWGQDENKRAYSLLTSSNWYFSIRNSTEHSYSLSGTKVSESINQWRHIVGVRKGSSYYLYENGVLVNQSSDFTGDIQLSTNPFIIGRIRIEDDQWPFYGTIDEVRVWNRALSPEEIKASYNSGSYRLYRNFTSLADGTYNYYAYAIDEQGYSAQTQTRMLIIDTSAIPECTDSDGGYNYEVKGTVVNESGSFTDQCWITGTGASYSCSGSECNLREGYCSGYEKSSVIVACQNCVDGACLPTATLSIDFEPPTQNNGASPKQSWAEVNVSVSSSYDTSSLIDWNRSLVGYWSFDSYSTTHVFDNSTYGNDCSFQGGSSENNITTGQYGHGMVFDDGLDYLDCGYDASLNITGDLTIEAWAKPSASLYTGAIAAKYSSDNSKKSYAIAIETGLWEFFIRNSASAIYYLTGTSFVANQWRHIVGVRNGNNYYLYENGVLVNQSSDFTGDIQLSTNPLLIGKLRNEDNVWPFIGDIDEVRVWNRALSPEEIKASYNSGSYRLYRNFTSLADGTYNYYAYAIDEQGYSNKTETRSITLPSVFFVSPTDVNGASTSRKYSYVNVTVNRPYNTSAFIDWNRSLVGYWSFESYDSNYVFDNSTYGNNGTLINSPVITSSGKYGKGIELDGINDFLNCSNDPSLNPTQAITVEAWVKLNNPDDSTCKYIVAKGAGYGSGGSSYGPYVLGYCGSSHYFYWDVWNETYAIQRSPSLVHSNKNVWYHVVGTYNASGMYTYVNGIQQRDIYSYIGRMYVTTRDTWIGSNPRFDTKYYFNGSIDEVRIWNRALSPQEVNASFNAGAWRLARNFTSLVTGSYNYYAYGIDLTGYSAKTETRALTITP